MVSPQQPPVHTLCLPAEAPQAVARAVEALCRGELVAFPTDTVYGVGAHAFRPAAVARLFAAKGRPPSVPIPLLLADAADLAQVSGEVPPLAWELARRFWPGALTLVVPRAACVPDEVTAGGPTVAVRVPDHALTLALCRALGAPLAATSANRHGQPSPVTAGEAFLALAGRIALLLDGGPSPGGLPSTLLDLTTSPPVLLRPGPVTEQQLADVLAGA